MPTPAVTTAAPVVTGEGVPAAAPADDATASATAFTPDKPYLVFVTDGSSKASDDCEKILLEDDKIELASRAFHATKMTPDQASAEALFKEKGGKAVPRVILVSADLTSAKALSNRLMSAQRSRTE